MTKLGLPACSMVGCEREAGAIINNDLLCGEHAALVLTEIVAKRGALEKHAGQRRHDPARSGPTAANGKAPLRT